MLFARVQAQASQPSEAHDLGFFSAIVCAVEMWLAGTFPLHAGLIAMGIYHLIISFIGEGLITSVVITAIAKSRPDILEDNFTARPDKQKGDPRMSGKSNMTFFYIGIAIALLLAVLAPFLASPDPDGFESAAGGVVEESKISELEESKPVVSAPIADYSIEGLGKSGEVAAVAVGTLAVLAIS